MAAFIVKKAEKVEKMAEDTSQSPVEESNQIIRSGFDVCLSGKLPPGYIELSTAIVDINQSLVVYYCWVACFLEAGKSER